MIKNINNRLSRMVLISNNKTLNLKNDYFVLADDMDELAFKKFKSNLPMVVLNFRQSNSW